MERAGKFALVLVLSTLTICDSSAQPACNMPDVIVFGRQPATTVYSSTKGEKAIFFTANLDINTDGAPKSYHPQDPRGGSLALNNMANAITSLRDDRGNNISCGPPKMRRGKCFDFFIEKFEAARDSNYSRRGSPQIKTTDIIPWRFDTRLGRSVPCLNTLGYFVSQTALSVNMHADVCDQSRYVDATQMNAIVLPSGARFQSQGTVSDQGDLAVVLDADTGKIAFAVVGDEGPPEEIGEGTVALAAALGGVTIPPNAKYAEMKALVRRKVHYLIFPSRDVPRLTNGVFSQRDIDRLGTQYLTAFGGIERLKCCANQTR